MFEVMLRSALFSSFLNKMESVPVKFEYEEQFDQFPTLLVMQFLHSNVRINMRSNHRIRLDFYQTKLTC